MPLRFARESRDISQVLIADLAHSAVATSIMGVTLVGTAAAAFAARASWLLVVSIVLCTLGSAGKLVLMAWQRRQAGTLSWRESRRDERGHAAATVAVAASVGMASSVLFSRGDGKWHVLATALLLGYCSGVVSRLSIRPWIAVAALTIAAAPVIVVSATWNDLPHRAASLIFLIFLPGAFDSVYHVHARAVRDIATRLDMAAIAHNDPLTGLANRLGLREAFRNAVEVGGEIGVLYLDLDGFKPVNDRMGHAAGDQILIEVAARVRTLAGEGTTVARVGGDEFVILKPGSGGRVELERIGHRIVDAIAWPFLVEGLPVTIGASLGHAAGPSATSDLTSLLEAADAALYEIKRAGGRGVRSGAGNERTRMSWSGGRSG